jgi:hypothetical protein
LILLDFTWFYLILLDFTWFYLVSSHKCTRLFITLIWVLLTDVSFKGMVTVTSINVIISKSHWNIFFRFLPFNASTVAGVKPSTLRYQDKCYTTTLPGACAIKLFMRASSLCIQLYVLTTHLMRQQNCVCFYILINQPNNRVI